MVLLIVRIPSSHPHRHSVTAPTPLDRLPPIDLSLMTVLRRPVLLLMLTLAPPTLGLFEGYFDTMWTERLGLAFSDDCQESAGLAAIWASRRPPWLSGRPRAAAVRALRVKGVQVPGRRRGDRASGALRARAQGRKPRALRFQATLWRRGARMRRGLGFVSAYGAAARARRWQHRCVPTDQPVGVVMRAGSEGRDYYAFKALCATVARRDRLPFDALAR